MTKEFIQHIKFDEQGLIPAVVQDAGSGAVLSLCYLDNTSLLKTLQTGQVSHLQTSDSVYAENLLDLRLNADGRSLTVLVTSREAEPQAARGESLLRKIQLPDDASASTVSLVDAGALEFGLKLHELYKLIADRKDKRPEGSYTTYLFNSGLDKILKKIAEESGEVIIAAKNDSPRQTVAELADLFYHLLVLMVERGIWLKEIDAELANRAGRTPQSQKK